nr:hypothetical protein [Mucilaginibacter sp. X5P1]
MGVACGPGYPLILHEALAARPVSATTPNANFTLNALLCVLFLSVEQLRMKSGKTMVALCGGRA